MPVPMVSRGIKDSFSIKGFRMFVDWLNDFTNWVNSNFDTAGDVTITTPGKGTILTNKADTKTKRVYLNDAGDGFLFEDP